MSSSFNFKTYRGDTLQINAAVTLSGTPFDLTGSMLFFTVKRRITDTDAQALIKCQTGAGIVHTNEVGGLVAIKPAEDLATMPPGVPLYADLQLKTSSGEIYTVAAGKLTFLADVTLRIS